MQVVPGTESLYQKYFEEILKSIDVNNFTNQTIRKPFDKAKIDSDYKIVERIASRAEKKTASRLQ